MVWSGKELRLDLSDWQTIALDRMTNPADGVNCVMVSRGDTRRMVQNRSILVC
jgi:hypothetical protein